MKETKGSIIQRLCINLLEEKTNIINNKQKIFEVLVLDKKGTAIFFSYGLPPKRILSEVIIPSMQQLKLHKYGNTGENKNDKVAEPYLIVLDSAGYFRNLLWRDKSHNISFAFTTMLSGRTSIIEKIKNHLKNQKIKCTIIDSLTEVLNNDVKDVVDNWNKKSVNLDRSTFMDEAGNLKYKKAYEKILNFVIEDIKDEAIKKKFEKIKKLYKKNYMKTHPETFLSKSEILEMADEYLKKEIAWHIYLYNLPYGINNFIYTGEINELLDIELTIAKKRNLLSKNFQLTATEIHLPELQQEQCQEDETFEKKKILKKYKNNSNGKNNDDYQPDVLGNIKIGAVRVVTKIERELWEKWLLNTLLINNTINEKNLQLVRNIIDRLVTAIETIQNEFIKQSNKEKGGNVVILLSLVNVLFKAYDNKLENKEKHLSPRSLMEMMLLMQCRNYIMDILNVLSEKDWGATAIKLFLSEVQTAIVGASNRIKNLANENEENIIESSFKDIKENKFFIPNQVKKDDTDWTKNDSLFSLKNKNELQPLCKNDLLNTEENKKSDLLIKFETPN